MTFPARKEVVMSDTDLASVSTDDLARTLRERLLAEPNPVWPFEVYKLVAAIGIIPCVDGFPVRLNKGDLFPEIGFIRRGTGHYAGKWWCVGGRINQGESFGFALKRHFRETLSVDISLPLVGLDWNRPVLVSQHGPEKPQVQPGEFAGDEPSKYCIAPTYLVKLESEALVFDATAHGGQEAMDFRWFPVNALPPEEEVAYNGMRTVQACVNWVFENMKFLLI